MLGSPYDSQLTLNYRNPIKFDMRTLTLSEVPHVLSLASALACLAATLVSPTPGFAGLPDIELEVIADPLPFYDGRAVRIPRQDETLPPLRTLMSRNRYWAEDGHLDIIAQLDSDTPAGTLELRLLDASGQLLEQFTIDPIPGQSLALYPPIPADLAAGGSGFAEVLWRRDGAVVASERESFRVERFAAPVGESGTIQLTIPNSTGATLQASPATVGVPFPRGVLYDTDHLRLLDEDGGEITMQVMETARWSKFGSIKWVLCDFTVDLAAKPRQLTLAYGPDVRRKTPAAIAVSETADGLPRVDAGRLRVEDGLWFDFDGDGNFTKILDARGLSGAFVEHEDGRIYRSPAKQTFIVEESGPEKVVLLRQGWYRDEASEAEFCIYITRYIIHRNSPLIRIFNTWVFTGDGNHDRLANMGWQFDLANEFAGPQFLTSFNENGEWLRGDGLLQWDYDHFDLLSNGDRDEYTGGRAPGVAAVQGDGTALYFGTKDFWQNFPSELAFSDNSLRFYNWPRRNRPAGYTFDKEMLDTTPGAPPSSAARYALEQPDSLTLSEWKLNAVQLRFAHEGEVLDFRLPEAFSQDPIWSDAIGDTRQEHNHHWERDNPESANAQGISRTEEMWLYFARDGNTDNAKAVLQGLNDETLRPIVDPVWIAASGAFGDIHPQDWDNFPAEERIYEIVALTPPNWAERLGAYGMWIHGDVPAWNLGLANKTPNLYRAYREGHHGWPYPWIPFARSGDPRLLKIVEASTRQMIDAYYCHYVSDDVAAKVGPNKYRRPGRWERSLLPWAARSGPSTRGYTSHSDHFWHSWYLTGYHRGRDIALTFGDQTKVEESLTAVDPRERTSSAESWFSRRRGPISHDRSRYALAVSYIDMYEATHDPWFLVAFHEILRMNTDAYRSGEASRIDFWRPWARDFHRFTGSDEFADLYLQMANDPTRWHHLRANGWGGTRGGGAPRVEPHAYAWRLSGDPYHLSRVAGIIDWADASIFDGDEPDYMRGWETSSSQVGTSMWVPWYLRLFPAGLAVLSESEETPISPTGFMVSVSSSPGEWVDGQRRQLSPVIALNKPADEPLPIFLSTIWGSGPMDYRLTGPDGETVLEGQWDGKEHQQLEVEAAAPAGTYRFQGAFERSGNLGLPLSEWHIPEVMELAPAAALPRAGREARYTFMVPEDVETFTVRFDEALRRLTVWDPDGNRAWDTNHSEDPLVAVITVKPEHRGKLWRITAATTGSAPRIYLDPQIPPVIAIDPHRWFNP